VDAAVRQLLAAYLVDGVEAPANLSVRIGATDEEGDEAAAAVAANGNGKRRSGRGQQIHLLYRSSSLVARSREPSRVLEALVSYLGAFLEEDPASLLKTSMLGLVADGHAIVAPRPLLGSLKVLQPRVERQGLRFVDTPFATIDPATGELVVPGAPLDIDEAALHTLDVEFGGRGRGRAEPAVSPGRYAIRGWAVFSGGPDDTGPLSRAKAVAAAAGSVVMGERQAQDVLETLGDMFRSVPLEAFWYEKPLDAAKQLVRLACV
jgi:hypothetical protein